ncbi:hypothetical protein EPA93_12880 [Ktedonosporobacter rubrisoli]|uniref:Uncharacterized protein n=1 Tax=Ktedonosporobacter rubrisoli TaxID=2509675 RepID=A0A4P6JNG3_KTERU|nr:hypothetical protein [Ktedonosporobacter rubrisoli]QBD76849.1 hypothetical protein EPA93_12880 [Ktedonosporobacter rubrisoli]
MGPGNCYPAQQYANHLRDRDNLDAAIAKLPQAEQHLFWEAASLIEEQYRTLTIDDAGAALLEAMTYGQPTDISQQAWYWQRRPPILPWKDLTPQPIRASLRLMENGECVLDSKLVQ